MSIESQAQLAQLILLLLVTYLGIGPMHQIVTFIKSKAPTVIVGWKAELLVVTISLIMALLTGFAEGVLTVNTFSWVHSTMAFTLVLNLTKIQYTNYKRKEYPAISQ